MANKRHKPKEIVTKLGQIDVLVGQGITRFDTVKFRAWACYIARRPSKRQRETHRTYSGCQSRKTYA